MNTDISHLLALFSSLSSSRGENTWKYKAIHEIAVNLDNLLSFFMSNTCSSEVPKLPKPRIPQAMLTHTKRQRKFELFKPKPSQLEEQPRLGATVQAVIL